MCRILIVVCLGASLLLIVSDAPAQSLRDRIDSVKRKRSRAASRRQVDVTATQQRSLKQKLRAPIDSVQFDGDEAQQAFGWWSLTSGVPLVIDWNGMEIDGIEPTTPINLRLNNIPAGQVLSLLVSQAEVEGAELIHQATPWYIRITTKRQANRETVLRVYNVSDLLQEVPSFSNAPQFDLNEALSNTATGGSGRGGGGGRSSGGGRSGGGRSGGGSGGSSGSLFGNTDANDADEAVKTRSERGEELAQLIRDTIEPEIWQANGGEHSSIRYHDGRLIVNAPQYVHAQIGLPVTTRKRSSRSVSPRWRSPVRRSTATRGVMRRRSSSGRKVSAVYD